MRQLIEAKIIDHGLTISQLGYGAKILLAKEAAQEVISNDQNIRRPKSLEEIKEDHEKNESIKTLEDSGINGKLEQTDDGHEKNESIKPLEDSGSDVEIEPTDEDDESIMKLEDDVEYRGKTNLWEH